MNRIEPVQIQLPMVSHTARDSELVASANTILRTMSRELERVGSGLSLYHTVLDPYNIKKNEYEGTEERPEAVVEDLKELTKSWSFIAAGDVIGSIWNFWWCLKELKKIVTEIEVSNLSIVAERVSAFEEQFRRRCSKIDAARHAFAHRAELSINIDRNAFTGRRQWRNVVKMDAGCQLGIVDTLVTAEYTYVTTRKGELVEFNFGPELRRWLVEQYEGLT